jgi:hypothetical protein
MIKFFRKIRQEMLSENKFSKYLIYAIGEIVLVVIGILIALQINISNEVKKARAVEINYLENLKADLLLENKNIEDFGVYHIEKAKSCTYLLNTTIPTTMEDVVTYTHQYENVFFWYDFVPNNNTFKELLSSGNLSLIKNDAIKNALLEIDNFYAIVSGHEYHMRREFEKFLYDRSVNNTESIIFFDKSEPKYGFPNRISIQDIPQLQHQQLIADAQWLYNDQTFNNGLRLAMMNNGNLAGIHKDMGVNIDNLLELIDEEIKK